MIQSDSICIISSALYISFRHQRFSLVTVVCHLSFTCLLLEFDLIPLVYFKRLISYLHSALFRCDFQAFVCSICIFLILMFILYLEINYLHLWFKKKKSNKFNRCRLGQKPVKGHLCTKGVFSSAFPANCHANISL